MFLFGAIGSMADTSDRPWAVQAKAGKMYEKGWVSRIASSCFFLWIQGHCKCSLPLSCHLPQFNPTSILMCYWLAGSELALQGTKCLLRLHCPRSACPFPNPCPNPWDTTSTAHNPSCPGWFSASLVYGTSLPRPRYLPFHIHLSSTISLNPPEMLMPSWCGHKGFSILQSLKGTTGEVWRNILPLQYPRRRLECRACCSCTREKADQPLPALKERVRGPDPIHHPGWICSHCILQTWIILCV